MNILFSGPESALLAEEDHRSEARALIGQGRDAPEPTPYSLQGSVATIEIQGSLINGNAGFMSFFGYTGYGDIRDSLVAAVSDQSVSSILLNIDSGGGHVAGVHELAQLIARVDKIKPVVTYTGGTMASAALWLGSGGRKVVASETALVGSLGILQVHIDRTKQMEQDGIKATVIRAGDDKALANPYEPLSDKAKADLQSQADEMYNVFLGHVAEQRKLPIATADKQFGGGRVFIGQQALSAGLVDQVGSYEAAFAIAAKLAERASKSQNTSRLAKVTAQVAAHPVADLQPAVEASHNQAIETSKETNMQANDLSDEALAALAGVDLAEPDDADDAAAVASLKTQIESLEAAAAVAAAELAAAATAKDEALARVAELEAAAEAAKPQFDAAVEIARASVRTMGASLGVAAADVAAMSTTEVLDNHKVLAEKFKAKYRVDRVAAVSPDPQPEAPKATLVDPLFAARVTRHN